MKAKYAKSIVMGFLLVISLAFTTACGGDKAAAIRNVTVEEEPDEEITEDYDKELEEIKDVVVVFEDDKKEADDSGEARGTENDDSEIGESNDDAAKDDTDTESVQNSPANESAAESVAEQANTPASTPSTGGHIVCIDPGHQGKGMSEHEPIGPGASETKPKVSSGTTGVSTGKAEYIMTLEVGLKLRDELRARGYTVIMTRESHDVSLSNADRATIATNAGAEVFIRLHGNGSDNHDVSGALTMCMSSGNAFNAYLHDSSRRLSDLVLSGLCNATGATSKGVTETDSMSGINWATMPVTIVEMGFMTNPNEDNNLSNADYQQKLAVGMANGIDSYFNN